jgi:hypothetical protein
MVAGLNRWHSRTIAGNAGRTRYAASANTSRRRGTARTGIAA